MLIKIGLVLLILVAAAYNRYLLVPRIEEDELAEDDVATQPETLDDERTAWRHLTRSVVAEVVGVVVVLGVTAALVNITPPKNAAAGTATSAVQNAPVANTSATVEVVLTPSKVGTNSVHITYFDSANRPVDTAQKVSVELTQPDQGIGPISA